MAFVPEVYLTSNGFFFECCSSPTSEIPPAPNVDPFNFDSIKVKVFEQLDAFVGIPFTVQRLAELITSPRKHYKRTDKFMRAFEKNMLVRRDMVDPNRDLKPKNMTYVAIFLKGCHHCRGARTAAAPQGIGQRAPHVGHRSRCHQRK